ncbi:uncharacterized protein FIBRA_01050 [Fibroporia radiculosa]|uniref:Cupin 2 conserved barrel domain-containing protein n=1 Tax=Fibroporia radiculosa TaxID=599839 RepID=J4I899_9APHY|nr:uncharacterized protein FIBRA_01050 [Fibroporia radiculosa]CCL99041.1 predicted protein [Fibroporia radiculosa]
MASAQSTDRLPSARRVVTGHDQDGKSCVRHKDDLVLNEGPGFPGVWVCSAWSTSSVPTNDNNTDLEGLSRPVEGDFGIVMHNGTNLITTDLAPGATAMMHQTTSLDYNILVSGTLVLELTDGTEVTFSTPGDVIVQRGTNHAWKNPGPTWTRWASVLVSAKPVEAAL